MSQNRPTLNREFANRLVRYNFEHQRPQGFFEWKNPEDRELGKKVKERGIVSDLVRSLEKKIGRTSFSKLRYGENPPDAVAADLDGNLVGFEVTELVDEQTIKARCCGIGKRKRWELVEVVNCIERIAQDKSRKLRASPYTKNILVIFTDEPHLRGNFCKYEVALNSHSFHKPSHIDEAFLLFSYFPGRRTCPHLSLNLR